MDKYEPISFIGKGNFGSITKIKRKIDGKILVWKEFNYGFMSEKERNRIVQEVNILRELHHPNIVKYYDRIIDHKNTKLYIVMEYCPGGDLSQLIKRNRKTNQYFSEDIIWKIFAQVSSALYACHTYKGGIILHRDIKPSNIFIDQDNTIKLGDFGLSRILNQDVSFAVSRVGTPYYMSPEQIDNIKYNEKSDIWSLGCFLYELTTLHPPFEANTHLNLARKIKSGKMDLIPSFYSQKLNELINSLMNVDPNKRPNIREIINIAEINLRIKEKRIKENLKKLKKMENMLKIRETNNQKKEEALMIKEKYLNEREKNINQREEYIKNKEEEFIKFEKNKYNLKDLSITSGNFNLKCLKITNDNSFMMSNSFSYKNIPMPKKQKSNQKDFMNKTDNLFYKNKENNNSFIKQKEYYSALNTKPNIKSDSTQNISYNNFNNNKNDSTQNVSYNINNKNESTQNMSNNINNNVLEINSNYILYNPSSEKKSLNKYMGTSPNAQSNYNNYNNCKNPTRNYNDNKKIIDNHQNNFSYDIEFRKNQCKIFNQKEIINDKIHNNINKKEYNKEYKDYIDKKFRKNAFNKIVKKSEKCINDEKAQSYNNKHKENIYNNHTINFNNADNSGYLMNNKKHIKFEGEMINENLSERFYNKNFYNNININKNYSSKLISPPKAFSNENINYYKPESDYFHGYNKNLRLGNLYFGKENEKIDKEEKKISQNLNSFNENNVKINCYRKSTRYDSKKYINTNYKKGSNNLNTINF